MNTGMIIINLKDVIEVENMKTANLFTKLSFD